MSLETIAGRVVASITIAGEASPRVEPTPAATALLRQLWTRHGALMFHQSGGCCDGSSPMCYPADEFLTSDADVLLGELDLGPAPSQTPTPTPTLTLAGEGAARVIPFWMSAEQFGYWRHTHLTVDVVPGRGGGFSLEAPEGVRFLIRSRLMQG